MHTVYQLNPCTIKKNRFYCLTTFCVVILMDLDVQFWFGTTHAKTKPKQNSPVVPGVWKLLPLQRHVTTFQLAITTGNSCQGRQRCEDHVWATSTLRSVCVSTQKWLYPITSVWNEANMALSIVLNELDNDWWHIVGQPTLF